MSQLPLHIEKKIQDNQITEQEKKLNRFKTVSIPLDIHLNNQAVASLIEFFMSNSNLTSFKNEHKSTANKQPSFNYKCISVQMGISNAPLDQPSLKLIKSDKTRTEEVRVLNFLFDTHDSPKEISTSFDLQLIHSKLVTFMKEKTVEHIFQHYRSFLDGLVLKYKACEKTKNFPLFKIKNVSPTGKVFYEDESLLPQTASDLTLKHIAIVVSFTKQDDIIPLDTKESYELFRRPATFWAYNPNKPSYTSLNRLKKTHSVLNRKDQFSNEIATVVFKDISFDPLFADCKQTNSIGYFFKRALKEQALEICGLRMVYLDDIQREEYFKLFFEEFKAGDSWDRPVLAVAVRGIEAHRKVEAIIGHFNPETARRTEEKSLRALFGRSRNQNCVLQVFNVNTKQSLELKYWFGGRVTKEEQQLGSDQRVSFISLL